MRIEKLELNDDPRRGRKDETIGEYLSNGLLTRAERGYSCVNNNMDESFWSSYGRDVTALLKGPQSSHWLNARVCEVLGPIQHRGEGNDIRTQRLTNGWDESRPNRCTQTIGGDEEAALEIRFRRENRGWRLFLKEVQRSLFTVCALTVWTSNIAAALTLPMMMVARSVNSAEIWYAVSNESHIDTDTVVVGSSLFG